MTDIKNKWVWKVQKINFRSNKVVNFIAECEKLKHKWVKFVCWNSAIFDFIKDGVEFIPTHYVPIKQNVARVDKETGFSETVEQWSMVLYDGKFKVAEPKTIDVGEVMKEVEQEDNEEMVVW